MTLIIFQRKIFEFKVEQVFYIGVDLHCWQGVWRAGELQLRLLHVVAVEMRIAERVDEFANAEIACLRHHMREECVAGNVEWHAEEDIGTSLVQLTR